MKKFILLIFSLFLTTGCGGSSNDNLDITTGSEEKLPQFETIEEAISYSKEDEEFSEVEPNGLKTFNSTLVPPGYILHVENSIFDPNSDESNLFFLEVSMPTECFPNCKEGEVPMKSNYYGPYLAQPGFFSE